MTETPSVSIIMPVRNEVAYIVRSLDSIIAQDYPPERMEILIANGKSTDHTGEIIADFYAAHPLVKIQIIDNPAKIVSIGMNLALRQTRGEIILRVDGHTVIAPDYVRQCVDALKRTNADNAGGKMTTIGITPFGKAVSLATCIPFGIGGGRFHCSDKEEWVDTVYMGAWPRQVFKKIGVFDEELVRDQDDEFNYRLLQQGGRILLSPDIRSEYIVRSTPRTLWQQYFEYGFWKVRVAQKHPHQMRLRQFVPIVFVLALLGSIFLALFPILRPLSLVIPVSYLLANLFVSFRTAAKQGWQFLTRLPLIFAILHLSYGLGFLVGLIKFWNRWSDKIGKVPGWSSEAGE